MPSAAGPKDSSDSCSKKEEVLRVLAKYGIYDNKVVLWGTGKPLREFLWSEDMADASVHVLLNVDFKDVIGIEKFQETSPHDVSLPDFTCIFKQIIKKF